MSQSELSNPLRSRLYLTACVALLLMSLTALVTAQLAEALFSLIFALLLAVNALLVMRLPEAPITRWVPNTTVAFIIVASLGSVVLNRPLAEQWSYTVPLISFFIFPVRIAILTVTAYSLLLSIALFMFMGTENNAQLFGVYLLCLMMTGAFVYMRENRNRQLKPLRRTDNLTLASTREHLTNDLEKEVGRSEREGTALAVMRIAMDQPEDLLGKPDHDALLHRLGRQFHENLRLFDSYYRVGEAEFLVLLPHVNTAGAMDTAEKLRRRIRDQLSNDMITVTVSAGVTSLNVDDSATALIKRASKALDMARKDGGNRSKSFVGELHDGEVSNGR